MKEKFLFSAGGCLLAALLLGCSSRESAGTFDAELASIYAPPVQTPADETFEVNGYSLHFRAAYVLAAKVAASRRYRSGDLSDIAPIDLALAWGPAADAQVQEELNISQYNRWFHWESKNDTLPLTRKELEHNMANVHILPADAAIAEVVMSLSVGSCVQMQGYLVDIDHPDKTLVRKTSMTRADTGAGACEILYATAVQKIGCQ